MARYRLPNYIARKTGWIAILNWWFLSFFAVEALLVVAHLNIIPISVPRIYIFGMDLGMWTVVLACWTLLFLVAMIWTLVIIRCNYIEFYDDYVIEKKGVIFRNSKKTIFPQIVSVKTRRNILGYGNVEIDVVGPWDVNLAKLKRPEDVREYLVDHMVNSVAVENIGNNPYIAAMANIF